MKKILSISAILGLLLGLTACGLSSEKDRFVSASIEVGCFAFQEMSQSAEEADVDPMEKVEEKTVEVFAKYGFDVSNEEAMEVLSEKYASDEEVLDKIRSGVLKCAQNLFNFDPEDLELDFDTEEEDDDLEELEDVEDETEEAEEENAE